MFFPLIFYRLLSPLSLSWSVRLQGSVLFFSNLVGSCVTDLNVERNDIGDVGARAVANFLKAGRHSLRKLNLAHNRMSGICLFFDEKCSFLTSFI